MRQPWAYALWILLALSGAVCPLFAIAVLRRRDLTAIVTQGLSVTFSTDPRRAAPRSPGEDEDEDEDEAVRRGAALGAGERVEDRARVDEEQAPEDDADPEP